MIKTPNYFPAIETDMPIAQYFNKERDRVFALLDNGETGAESAVSGYLDALVEETNRQLKMLTHRMINSFWRPRVEEAWMMHCSTIPMLSFWMKDAVRAKEVGIDPPLLDEHQLDILEIHAYFEEGYINPIPIIEVMDELRGL